MQFRDLNFRVRWVPTILLALPGILFIGLGVWQLDRAEQKRALARMLEERALQAPVSLQEPIADPDLLHYRSAAAVGRYDADGQFFIEGRRHNRQAGFHVITPLLLDGSEHRLLVNRGWIAARSDGSPTQAPVPDGLREVEGEAEVPSPPALVLHGADDAARHWGDRWPYLTVDLFAAISDGPVQPVVLLLDPSDPDGFVRRWKRRVPNPAMHLGYAAQWFGFAVIALVIYLRLSIVRSRAGQHQNGSRIEDV